MGRKDSTFKKLLPLLVQSFTGIVLMYILWLIMRRLPMLAGIPFSLRFSLYSLVEAPILLILVGMIVRFSMRMDSRLNYFYPGFPYWGQLVKNTGCLIGVLITYLALRPLLVPYMGRFGWIFHALFLAGFVAFLGILIYLIVNVMQKALPLLWGGKLSNFGSGGLCVKCDMVLKPGAKFCPGCGTKTGDPAAKHSDAYVCLVCKTPVLQGAQFCPGCGTPVAVTTAPPVPPVPAQLTCIVCKRVLKEGARFCPGCGTPVGNNAVTESAATVPLDQQVCVSCKAALKSGSSFCPNCGSPQR